MSGYELHASATDKFFVCVNELRPPFVIQLTLEGDGDPEPETLFDALEQTTAVNPGSSLKLDQTGAQPKWVIGPPPTLTVVDAPEFEAQNGENAPFLMWPLDSYTGPTCELVYVRGKNKNYLIFRALHAVMDGQGTLNWVRDFMRSLRGEKPVGHPSTLNVEDVIRALEQDRRRPYPAVDALHPFGHADLEAPGMFHWKRIQIDKPLDSNASGRICVALAERARRDGAEGVVRVNLPTDLRRYYPDERSTANLFSSLYIEVSPETTPDAVTMKIVQLLYKNEGTKSVGMYSVEEAGSLNLFRVKTLWDLNHLHDTGLYAFSATLSHLGVLKSDELSAPTFQTTGALFIPLVGDSGCVVSLNGFDDRTEGAVGLSDRFTKDGQLDELAEIIRGALL